LIRRLLQVPLGLKLLVANGLLLAAAAATGLALGRAEPPLAGPSGSAILIGILLGMIGMNRVLVKIALGPVKNMEAVAERVARGDLKARVPPSPVADRSLRRLIWTFNGMLEATERTGEARDRLARDLLEAGERDRKALAEELLARPAQSLSTTLLLLRGGESGNGAAGVAAEAVREALEELRRISAALHPPELDELGLATALRALVRSRLEARGIASSVEVAGAGEGLPGEVRLGTFRLIQEGIELAARIPGLEAAALRLRRDGGVLLVHLELTGVAPDLTDRDAPGGMRVGLESGLLRMQERSRLLGGAMELQIGPDPELAVRIRIPVDGATRPPCAHLHHEADGLSHGHSRSG
jgi:signal transduction histidine kinase